MVVGSRMSFVPRYIGNDLPELQARTRAALNRDPLRCLKQQKTIAATARPGHDVGHRKISLGYRPGCAHQDGVLLSLAREKLRCHGDHSNVSIPLTSRSRDTGEAARTRNRCRSACG